MSDENFIYLSVLFMPLMVFVVLKSLRNDKNAKPALTIISCCCAVGAFWVFGINAGLLNKILSQNTVQTLSFIISSATWIAGLSLAAFSFRNKTV